MRNIIDGDFQQGGHEFLVAGNVAQAPPIHGKSLGVSKHTEGAVPHSGQRGDADMLVVIVDNLFIYLVADDKKIIFNRQIRDDTEFFTTENPARRIPGVDD